MASFNPGLVVLASVERLPQKSGTVGIANSDAGDGRFARLLCEKIGPTKMGMALVPDGDHLRYLARRWSFFGIPLPKTLAPMGEVYESTVGDRFVFHVEINVPIVGHIVTYHGELDVREAG